MFNFLKKKKAVPLHAIADGCVINLSEVPDEVFSNRMMGDGFAIKPTNGVITSPVEATVENIFPTKHALGLKTDKGIEILLHLGIDTVELNGEPFEMCVQVGDKVTPDTVLAKIDLEKIKAAKKSNELMVIFTNGDIQSIDVQYGDTKHGMEIGTLQMN